MLTKSRIPKRLSGADFTLKIGCSVNCWYCPQHKIINAYSERFGNDGRVMSLDTFKICLSRLYPDAGISFAGMCEPFLNPDCVEMIRYGYAKGHDITLATTLVGLSMDGLEQLSGIEFRNIQLHIPDIQYKSRFTVTDEYLKIFKKFIDNFKIDAYSCHGDPLPVIEPLLDTSVCISSAMGNRAGNLEREGMETHQVRANIECANGALTMFAGYCPEVLPNGVVVLCCNDYNMDHVLGDLTRQEFVEMLVGEEYRKFEMSLRDEKVSSLCRRCGSAASKHGDGGRFYDVYDRAKYLEVNAARVGRVLELVDSGINDPGILGISTESVRLFRRILDAGTVCIFGLGKLFCDNYFTSGWHDVLQADILCDNDASKWGSRPQYNGLICVTPENLREYDDLLIITYCTNPAGLNEQLGEMGLHNLINIINIYDVFR